MKSVLTAIVIVLAGLTATAFPEVPKESAIALGATKGKSFESGLVFINGKFLPPPYLVERWGTGVRINGKPVTGQLVDWNEFLKTQSGVKETKASAPAVPAAPTAAADETDDDSSLDDLFDDNPKPKKKGSKPKKKTVSAPKPTTAVSYSLEGEFSPNETTRRYVKNINAIRSRIDRSLREGAVVFFGDSYRRVTVIPRLADDLIRVLPEIMRDSKSAEDLYSKVHAAQIEYLPEQVCTQLYRNRIDYRSLQEHRTRIKRDRELQKFLKSNKVD